MQNNYYLYLPKNFFEEENMICISLNDQEFWILRESKEPDFYYTRESIGFTYINHYNFGYNGYHITPSAFFKIKSLSKKQKHNINKYGHPIELFKSWGVLDEVIEHFI